MKKVRIIIAVVTVALMIMGIGYAAWSTKLFVSASGYVSTFDVYIDGTQTQKTDSGAVITYDNTNTATTATITASGKFYPGRSETYTFTVKNNGTVPVIMTGVAKTGTNPVVTLSYNIPTATIAAGQTATFTVTLAVDPNLTTNNKVGGNFSFTVTPTYAQNP